MDDTLDYEYQDQFSFLGQTNNPPPTQFDIAGPRRQHLDGWIASSLDCENLFPSPRPNQYNPAGTRTFDQYELLPVEANFYLQNLSIGEDIVGHDYVPTHVLEHAQLYDGSETTLLHPAMNESFISTTPTTNLLLCDGMEPNNMFDNFSYSHSAEIGGYYNPLSSEGITAPSDSGVFQSFDMASCQNNMMIGQHYLSMELLNESSATPSTFIPTNSNNQAFQIGHASTHVLSQRHSQDLDSQHLLSQAPTGTTNRFSKREGEVIERQVKKYRQCTTASQGEFGWFSTEACPTICHNTPNISQPRVIAQRTSGSCLRCRRGKLKCRKSDWTCGPCPDAGHSCVTQRDLVLPFTIPNMIIHSGVDFNQQTSFKLLVSDPVKARIFVKSGYFGPVIPLECKVQKYRVNVAAEDLMLEFGVWEDTHIAPARTTPFQPGKSWEDRKEQDLWSYCIPEHDLPSAEEIKLWAVRTLCVADESAKNIDRSASRGVVGKFHGELWMVSTLCLQSENFNHLHELLSLVREYTAIYNVYHSKISLIFDEKPDLTWRVCLWLRNKICSKVLTETGTKLNERLKETIVGWRDKSEKTQLVLCIVFWFLMLIHEHVDSEMRITEFLSIRLGAGSPEDLPEACQRLTKSLLLLHKSYENGSKETKGITFPALVKQKGKGKKGQDGKLHLAISELQTAMHSWGQDFQPVEGSMGAILKSLIDSEEGVRGPKASSPPDSPDLDECSHFSEANEDCGAALLQDLEIAIGGEDNPGMEWDGPSQSIAQEASELPDRGFGTQSIKDHGLESLGDWFLRDLEISTESRVIQE